MLEGATSVIWGTVSFGHERLHPAKVRPVPLPAEKRKSLKVPLLFVFGERDNLVGDPKAAGTLVQDIPDVRVEVVSAGHLLAAEQPNQVNGLITGFFDSE